MHEDAVAVTVVPNEAAAGAACGLLRANGIECEARQTDTGAANLGTTALGPVEILVRPDDLERARGLLGERS